MIGKEIEVAQYPILIVPLPLPKIWITALYILRPSVAAAVILHPRIQALHLGVLPEQWIRRLSALFGRRIPQSASGRSRDPRPVPAAAVGFHDMALGWRISAAPEDKGCSFTWAPKQPISSNPIVASRPSWGPNLPHRLGVKWMRDGTNKKKEEKEVSRITFLGDGELSVRRLGSNDDWRQEEDDPVLGPTCLLKRELVFFMAGRW